MVQGFALGGEVGPTTAYLIEIASPQRRGTDGILAADEPADRSDSRRAGGCHPEQDDAGRSAGRLWLADCVPDRGRLPAVRPLDAPDIAGDDPRTKTRPRKPSESVGPFGNRPSAHARLITLALLILASGTIATYVTQYMTTYARDHVAGGADPCLRDDDGQQRSRHRRCIARRLAGGPVRPQAGDDLAAARHTGVDLSHLPVDRSFARRACHCSAASGCCR